MSATVQRVPTDFWEKWESTRATDVRPQPIELTDSRQPRGERSLGRRAMRGLLRFLITLGIGIGGTLAWQAYGDDVRQLMAVGYPDQLGWIAPQAATTAVAPSSDVAALAAAAPPIDQQQLNALSLNLAAVRQSVEQLATQVASGQQQTSGDLAWLQASEQDILNKISAPPPRPAAVRKPTPPPVAIAAPPAVQTR